MVGCKFYIKRDSDWLTTLLESTFFDPCEHHRDLRKNEKNVFCIDCSLDFCKHCSKTHRLHRKLQICKYVYQDVVRLQDLQKHLDCSKIQTYKINGEKAVHLNPRPQPKDAKPSTKAKFGAACEACQRYIQDQPNRFCSIACKVSIVSENPEDQSHEMITFSIEKFPDLSLKNNSSQERHYTDNESSSPPLFLTHMSVESHKWMPFGLKPRKRLHKRKGVPFRSPFC